MSVPIRVSLLQQVIAVESYGDSELQMSDPVLAAQIDETDVDDSFRRENLRVLPLPTRAFLVGQEMGLYFEVYNLVADDFGQTRYRVTIQIAALEQVEGLRMLLTGQEVNPEVSMSFEQVDTQPSVQVYQFCRFDKGETGTQPGENYCGRFKCTASCFKGDCVSIWEIVSDIFYSVFWCSAGCESRRDLATDPANIADCGPLWSEI